MSASFDAEVTQQDRIRLWSAAAFYLLALAAQVSGYTNALVAIGLAAIATIILIVPCCHYVKRWHRQRAEAGKATVEPLHLIVGGLIGLIACALVVLGGVLWQQQRGKLSSPNLSEPVKPAALAFSEFEWGFERHPGYPFIGMMGGKHYDPPVIFQFQAQGRNRTKDPLVKARPYVRSDRTGRIYPGFFNIHGKFVAPDEINPIPVNAIIDIHAHFTSDRKPISIRQFLDEVAPVTFFFEYDGKQYRRSFSQEEIETLVRRSEQQMRPETPAPQMTQIQKSKTHPHDIPKKLTIIDEQINPIFRSEGELELHIRRGGVFQSNWRSFLPDRPKLLAQLHEYRVATGTLFDKLYKIQQSNAHFDDIAGLLDVGNSGKSKKFSDGFSAFMGDIGAIGDPPYTMDLQYFVGPHAEAFREGLDEFGRWRHDTEHEFIKLRKQIASGER